jgi:hypothetical protein
MVRREELFESAAHTPSYPPVDPMLPDAAEVDGTQHANGAGLEVIFTSDSPGGARRLSPSRLRKAENCHAAAPAAKVVMKTSCLTQR